MSRRRWARHVASGVALLALLPGRAVAQPGRSAPAGTTPAAEPSAGWLVTGVAWATLRGDCQTCEQDFPYRHSASLLVNAGRRVSPRMDVGAELFWMPISGPTGRIHTTHVDAVAEFRLWPSRGFFLKGGAGLAFVRNWVDTTGDEALRSKGLSVVIGAGWAFRRDRRIGWQVFGSQHVVALGDFQTSAGPINDVVGNFWSLGGALVIR